MRRKSLVFPAGMCVLLLVTLVALPAAIRGAASHRFNLGAVRETSAGMVHLGFVEEGRIQLLAPQPSLRGMVQLTSIQMQAAQSPESGEIDLCAYERRVIVVRGLDSGGWVYSAQVCEVLGPVSTGLLRYAYGTPLAPQARL